MPMIGQIALLPYNFSPASWMRCDGQTMPISENETLFQVLLATFGGDGQETYKLPDLRVAPGTAYLNMPDFTPEVATMGYHISLFGTFPSQSSGPNFPPFMSELYILPYGFAPKGFAQCNGQLMPINQNQALFSLLGTQFGGNGQTNFALPDMRVPGQSYHRGFEYEALWPIRYYIALQGIFPSSN